MEDEANRFVTEGVDEVAKDGCERKLLSICSRYFCVEYCRAFAHVDIRSDGAKECTKDEKDCADDGYRCGKRWDCWSED